ncbi:hypothetical protein CEXT_366991 [Caerostris extrusa]|uniref:Uncharacterized protein n=1 Tax=Caerostris extrusa TaxID=172846 RepID=A0AAV4PW11_CAEEX|nr:hypothetical protein CEXT_366991 [Caerostris extrusa]
MTFSSLSVTVAVMRFDGRETGRLIFRAGNHPLSSSLYRRFLGLFFTLKRSYFAKISDLQNGVRVHWGCKLILGVTSKAHDDLDYSSSNCPRGHVIVQKQFEVLRNFAIANLVPEDKLRNVVAL